MHHARWPDIAAAQRTLLLWPIGSTEQHGPHLPMGTDTLIAQALADAAHQLFPATGLAPAQPVGASGEHEHFPGTLSIGTPALTQIVVEFVRHATRHWAHVLIINGHGGNHDALREAVTLLTYEGRSVHVHHATHPDADPHAGHHETSLLLHLHPHLVRTDLAAPGNTTPISDLMPALRAGGTAAVAPNGILGDPTHATAAHGRSIFHQMLRPLLTTVHALFQGAGITVRPQVPFTIAEADRNSATTASSTST
ncbi:mycofactocin biosynthesis peptidyl-dipeptidase MftE [Nakamurella sp. YIM 132087]|uniref:Mycofactocin biosynthesis peptidyl-dipeptidase MftE n=1 Tax=Nakamurella alba TaxID=2665158 RepID=A0A7K1FMU5_9ACTN|nr:mycofactocin biosynthesis peptidyl-dipeptidase MftE [Nakamurella alba]